MESTLSQEAIFFAALFVMTVVAYAIAAIVETIILKKTEWIDSAGVLKYVLASNILGCFASCVFFGLVFGLFLLFFSATLGGAFWISLLSLLGAALLLVGIPAIMFGGRQVIRRFARITQEQLTWKYALLAAAADFVFLLLFVLLAFSLLTVVSSVVGARATG